MTAAALMAAAALAFPSSVRAGPPAFRVGEPVPDVYLPSLNDGKMRSLASFAGRKVLLIHFASW